MDKIAHEMRLAQWTNIIQACAASGLHKRTWCQQNGIDEKQFYYWQRRIRKQVFEVQNLSESTPLATTTFVEMPTSLESFKKKSSSNQVAATIYVNGCIIEISESASESFLKSLIGAIAYAK